MMRNLVPTGRSPLHPRRNIVARHLHGLGSGRKRHGWSLRRMIENFTGSPVVSRFPPGVLNVETEGRKAPGGVYFHAEPKL